MQTHKKLGIIGSGNIAQAILKGALHTQAISPEDVFVYDIRPEVTGRLESELGVISCSSSSELCKKADLILLAVKPFVCRDALKLMQYDLTGQKALISVVTGWTKEDILKELHKNVRILRVVPNTPALVGEGCMVLDAQHTLRDDEFSFAERLFAGCGEIFLLPEESFEAVTGLSGSGPAFVYQFITALANGGLFKGIPSDISYRLAARTVLGSAKMVLESGIHPGQLKDMVMTPGGTTITGIHELEKGGFNGVVMDAVAAATDKASDVKKG
ncbi:MAG: pyrroline-5-carboxylate reductase [Christensenellales bacterium]|jgi:pyrroline-5-carboxylate reductase